MKQRDVTRKTRIQFPVVGRSRGMSQGPKGSIDYRVVHDDANMSSALALGHRINVSWNREQIVFNNNDDPKNYVFYFYQKKY